MRIALFSETYPPLINGVSTHVKCLRDGLVKEGHEVLVLYADPKAKSFRLKEGVLVCPSLALKKIYGFGLADSARVARSRYLSYFMPEIIHIHSEFGIGLAGVLAAKRLDVPFVHTMHTMYKEYMHYIMPKILTKPGLKVAQAYARYIGERAKELIGPSRKIAEFFKACGVKKEVNIISNTVELDLFDVNFIDKAAIKEVKNKYRIADNDFVLCFCGRLGKEKSVDLLLKFFSHVIRKKQNSEYSAGGTAGEKMKLMIIGDGPCANELKELTVKLKISDKVIFTGRVEHDQMPPYYAACNMYVTASTTEIDSISMKEAMATNLPALYIADKLNRDQIIHGGNGFIYRNADEMYNYIQEYCNYSPDLKEKMRKKARESVVKYGFDEWIKRVLDVYKKALLPETTR